MALTTRKVKPATAWLSQYKSRVGSSGAAWSAGVQNPRVDFRKAGAAAQADWFAGVQAAYSAGTYAKGLEAVTDAELNTAYTTYGPANYQTQTVAKAAKYGAYASEFAPVLENIITSLDTSNPRGDYNSNKQRAAAFLDAMHATKGKYKQ